MSMDRCQTSAEMLLTTTAVPQWLNNGFLEKYLQQFYSNQGIRVIESSTSLAVGDGDNYASRIYRVKVVFSGSKDNSVRVFNFNQRLPFFKYAN